jgi:hypothetical protein
MNTDLLYATSGFTLALVLAGIVLWMRTRNWEERLNSLTREMMRRTTKARPRTDEETRLETTRLFGPLCHASRYGYPSRQCICRRDHQGMHMYALNFCWPREPVPETVRERAVRLNQKHVEVRTMLGNTLRGFLVEIVTHSDSSAVDVGIIPASDYYAGRLTSGLIRTRNIRDIWEAPEPVRPPEPAPATLADLEALERLLEAHFSPAVLDVTDKNKLVQAILTAGWRRS